MRALIFAGGDPVPGALVEAWVGGPGAPLIVAANGGSRHALAAGWAPAVLIGDLDSLPAPPDEDLTRSAAGPRRIVHPRDKDQSDLELALEHVLAEGAREIVVFGGWGDRWDQSLSAMLLLALPARRGVPAWVVGGRHRARLVMGGQEARIDGRPGDTLSLLALAGDALGVSIEGCRFPLRRARLAFGTTLGLSNALVEPSARLRVEEGAVLSIHIQADREEEAE